MVNELLRELYAADVTKVWSRAVDIILACREPQGLFRQFGRDHSGNLELKWVLWHLRHTNVTAFDWREVKVVLDRDFPHYDVMTVEIQGQKIEIIEEGVTPELVASYVAKLK